MFQELIKAQSFAAQHNIDTFDVLEPPYKPEIVARVAHQFGIKDIIYSIILAFCSGEHAKSAEYIKSIKKIIILPALQKLSNQGLEIISIDFLKGSAYDILSKVKNQEEIANKTPQIRELLLTHSNSISSNNF